MEELRQSEWLQHQLPTQTPPHTRPMVGSTPLRGIPQPTPPAPLSALTCPPSQGRFLPPSTQPWTIPWTLTLLGTTWRGLLLLRGKTFCSGDVLMPLSTPSQFLGLRKFWPRILMKKWCESDLVTNNDNMPVL